MTCPRCGQPVVLHSPACARCGLALAWPVQHQPVLDSAIKQSVNRQVFKIGMWVVIAIVALLMLIPLSHVAEGAMVNARYNTAIAHCKDKCRSGARIDDECFGTCQEFIEADKAKYAYEHNGSPMPTGLP
ncbi:MAG: hypothetical protein ACYC96_09570 [Fimbriimonadaceae bacterium]